jgi:phage-related protein
MGCGKSEPIWKIALPEFFIHNNQIVLLHGFIKKTQQTPKEDIELALTRKSRFLATN